MLRRPRRVPRPARAGHRHARTAALAASLALAAGLAAGARSPGARAQPAPGEPAWHTVLGGFDALEDVAARGPDDLWAVGDGIVRWDGAEWRQVVAGPRPRLRAIAALPDGTMWAVGARAAGPCDLAPIVLRYDGDAWREEPVETHQPLWDVAMVAPNDGWAVGGIERPVILRYDGARWRPFAEPEIGPLRAVDLVAPDDGWAVGLDGALARWDGRDWRAVAPPRAGFDLHDVALVDEGFGWAVGAGIDPLAGVVLALRDGEWTIASLDRSPVLTAVAAPTRDVALAVGRYGTLLRWDGAAWRDVGRTYPGGFVPTGGEPDPVGGSPAEGASGPAGSGSRIAAPPRDPDVPLVPRLPPDASARPAYWPAVGSTSPREVPPSSRSGSGTGADGAPRAAAALRRPVAPAAAALPALPAQEDEPDPYARLMRDEVLAERVYLRGLAVLVDDEAMVAVGDAGQVVVIEDAFYQEVHAGRSLDAIDLLPDGSEGWIVGRDGPPLRWDGRAWRPEPGPIEVTWLRDVAAAAPGVAWAVGDAGTVMRFAGGRWARVPFPTTDDLLSVAFGGAGDGWTFVNDVTQHGYEARVYRWDGAAWREAIHLCGVSIGSAAADGRGGAWFAVANAYGGGLETRSSVLRFDGRAWWWVPMLGARDPGGPASRPVQLDVGPDGSGWAAGQGLARLDGAAWRSLVDTARLARWDDPVRAIYLEAVAARDRGAAWGLLPNYRWTEDDDASGTGTWVAWFAPGAGFDPADPDRALGLAHLSTVALHDLAVARGPDGTTDVWAVGQGATILRRRLAEPAGVPEATATEPSLPSGGWPTPTPHAVLGRAAAEAWARGAFPLRDGDELEVTRIELVDRAGALARLRAASRAAGRADAWRLDWGLGLDDDWFGDYAACAPGWLPWWWIEARGEVVYGCDRIVGALDAVGGQSGEFLCYDELVTAYLPFAQTRRTGPAEPTPTPRPSATARSVTPVAAASVDGPCPTPTPYPTGESWPYP